MISTFCSVFFFGLQDGELVASKAISIVTLLERVLVGWMLNFMVDLVYTMMK